MLRLCIDAGHGGDPAEPGIDARVRARRSGCVVGNMTEADYNLCLARFLAARLRHSGEPLAVDMIRSSPIEELSHAERARRSKEFGADLVLVLHVNSYKLPTMHGGIMFYMPGDAVGLQVATALSRAWPEPLHRRSREMFVATDKPGPADNWLLNARAVLDRHEMTAVLVEVGFGSHPGDLAALQDPATQSAMVAALVCGVARMRQLKEAGTT